jgi:hypothetical protein
VTPSARALADEEREDLRAEDQDAQIFWNIASPVCPLSNTKPISPGALYVVWRT